MVDNLKFEGWVAESGEAADGHMVWKEFQPKAWEETDIDIRVSQPKCFHCCRCALSLIIL